VGDECRRCQRRLGGHSCGEAQPEVGHSGGQVLVTGVDQDQGTKFMRDSKEPVQARVGELDIPDPRADLDTEETRLVHAPAHLLDGPVGVLQCDGAQRSEASWMLVGDPGEELVLRQSQFGSAGGRRPVAERHRNRGKNLHPNAFRVHVDKPGPR
jgi:hypothetical protein